MNLPTPEAIPFMPTAELTALAPPIIFKETPCSTRNACV